MTTGPGSVGSTRFSKAMAPCGLPVPGTAYPPLSAWSAQEIEDSVEKMCASVAKREINPRSSYVTKWNPKLKRAELAAGSWCQDGEVFGAQPFDMTKFPVDMIGPEEE